MKKDKNNYLHTILMCISILILVLILMLLLVRCRKTEEVYAMPEIEQGVREWSQELERSGAEASSVTESIAIPGYSNLVISSSDPYLSLINPSDNSVYMVYSIYEGDILLFETGAISPNKELSINLYELLSSQTEVGSERDISFKISTYDCITYEPCNGATQKVHVTIL